jgi:formylglycine-generating enzyme required for sulfatase activity
MPDHLRRSKQPGVYDLALGAEAALRAVFVPPGAFPMGVGEPSIAGEFEGYDEGPAHQHLLTDGFYLGQHEVPWGPFNAFRKATDRDPLELPLGETEDHPVAGVSWHEARAFCDWAGVDLPTEAQWERAARGLDGRTYPWGTEAHEEGVALANHDGPDAFERSAPIGSFARDVAPVGAFDMAGNVSEWCQDWYSSGTYALCADGQPLPERGQDRVHRGGNWALPAGSLRATRRGHWGPEVTDPGLGFRIVVNPR